MRFGLASSSVLVLSVVVACGDDGTSGSGGSAGEGGSGGEGGHVTGAIEAPITRYDYAIDLGAGTATVTLSQDVAAPGGNCVRYASELDASDVPLWNDAPAEQASLSEQTLEVCGEGLSEGPLRVAVPVTLVEKTFLGLDVGFSTTKNAAAGDFTYLLSWVGGCDHFGPCRTETDPLSEFFYDIRHDDGVTVLCPGKRTATATNTKCELTGTLAPTYSAVAFAADTKWQKKDFLSAAGVDVVFFEVPGGELQSSLDTAEVSAFFTWITGLLGPMPYGSELRFAGGPTAWLGFEHPANIILNEDLPSLPTDYENPTFHVFMHEVIHQWAGDRTTLSSAPDFVWKEATAEYLAYVFEDESIDAVASAATRAYWDSISLQADHYPRPMDEPAPAVEAFYGDVYGPGPMVLYLQLEDLIGRAAVLAGIKSFLAEPGARSVAELQAALEVASGEDLGPYFDVWVRGTGKPEWPTYAIQTMQTGDVVTVTLTQENASGKLYGSVVEVEVRGATLSAVAKVDFGLAPTSAVATATVMLAEPIVSAALDPAHRLVARTKGFAPTPKKHVWRF